MKIYLLSLLFLNITFNVWSQTEKVKLSIVLQNKNRKNSRILNYQGVHKDSIAAIRELKRVISTFQKSSYILVNIDSIKNRNDSIIAFLDPGYPFKWSILTKGNVSDDILSKVGFKERLYRNSTFNYREYSYLQEAFLKYSENHGYPFATIRLDSVKIINEDKIAGSLDYRAGPLITFDSINIIGNSKTRKKFLISYLRIFPEQPFNQEKINSINQLLKQLPYLKQTRTYTISFSNNKAKVNLFLEDRKSNQVDGIVGLLPNTTANKKMLITGELNMNLKNLFGTGKIFSGEWRKFNQASQLLNLYYIQPKLFSSNIDLRFDFNLFKQDSTFLSLDRKITLYQRTGKSGTINFSGGDKSSRQLINKISHDTTYASFDFYNYGMGYNWNNLDDIYFPHSGFLVNTQISGGNKKIRKNAAYPDSIYNKIKLNSVQVNLNIILEKYTPLSKRSVLLTRFQGGKLINNKENIFFNDLYRVGGLKSLRGFAENYFYASAFAVATCEYRFFTEENSYLLLFYDQGYINNVLSKSRINDFPFGFGVGVSFSTGAGIFNFVYSLGNSSTQKISLNLSKIHFGIVTRF